MRPEKEKGSVGRNDGEKQKSGKYGGGVRGGRRGSTAVWVW